MLARLLNDMELTDPFRKDRGMHQPAPVNEPFISVKGQKLQDVNQFTYLGSTLA